MAGVAQRADCDPANGPAPGRDGAGTTDTVCVHGCEGGNNGNKHAQMQRKSDCVDSFVSSVPFQSNV